MDIRVKNSFFARYAKALTDAGFEEFATKNFSRENFGSSNDRSFVNLESTPSIEIVDVLEAEATALQDGSFLIELNNLRLLANSVTTPVVKSLSAFATQLEKLISKNKIDGWLYSVSDGKALLPFLVAQIGHASYCSHTKTPAHAFVKLHANIPEDIQGRRSHNSTEVRKLRFYSKDIRAKNVAEILAKKYFFIETHSLKEQYLSKMEDYNKLVAKMGEQFLVSGYSQSSYHNCKVYNNVRMINDEDTSIPSSIEQSLSIFIETKTKNMKPTDLMDSWAMDNMEEKISKNEGHIEDYPIPFHPFIRMFNLENHSNEWVLSSYLNEYKYDKSLSKKLILPDDHQDLIDILVNDSDVILEDIVQGKTGGTTILCRGPAGLGKTLTAQVYSETIGKPIYEVNAGQLGLNPDNIESNLEKILNRAEKWGAITVINEADVFIKKRGDTLIDNAIVASFLNQIERYRGIIFFTTNRMDIDDAVISRCEAVITYKYPDQKKQHLIWRVLADNYNVEVSDKVISQITAKYEKLSGRDIKELLKLANKFISQRNEIFSLELIRKCAMFRDIGTIEK